jgi:hypothetical protein
MAVTAASSAPYAPSTAILDIIGRYRNRGLPTPITAEVLGRAGVSDSLIPRTLQALQALELIDDQGKPTPTFEGIRKAPEAEYQQRLVAWLRGAYADVFSFVDPATDDEIKVRDAFRNYTPVGQQARMVTLFLGLCAAAGMLPQGETKTRTRPARPISSGTPNAGRSTARPQSRKQQQSKNSSTEMPSALAGLMASLPSEGHGWTQAEHDKFLKTFGAVLDFCFPIVSKADVENIMD